MSVDGVLEAWGDSSCSSEYIGSHIRSTVCSQGHILIEIQIM